MPVAQRHPFFLPPFCFSVVQFVRTVCEMKREARFVSYQDLHSFWRHGMPPFEQLPVNVDESDTFPTSWSADRGHHLFCWEKVIATPITMPRASLMEESKEAMVEDFRDGSQPSRGSFSPPVSGAGSASSPRATKEPLSVHGTAADAGCGPGPAVHGPGAGAAAFGAVPPVAPPPGVHGVHGVDVGASIVGPGSHAAHGGDAGFRVVADSSHVTHVSAITPVSDGGVPSVERGVWPASHEVRVSPRHVTP